MSRIRGSRTLKQLVHLEVRERRVGHRLHVLDPLAGGALGLEQARVLDRERSPVGHELQQLDLVLLERARHERADMEHARTSPSTTSGTPSIDLIPFSRRIGLRTCAWSTSSRITGRFSAAIRPAKPPPDRDADALLDLLLDAERRARDELVRLLVEQEDRARVDLEDLPGPLEQSR